MAQNIPELYGSLVFNDKVMRSKLPKDMYKALKKTIYFSTTSKWKSTDELFRKRTDQR